MKELLLCLAMLAVCAASAQKKITRTGMVKFEASMPAVEEVKAVTKTASGVLNTSNGEVAFLVLIKSFKFKVPLMEEHFNENYMESDKYPKATFKGTIRDFNMAKLTSSPVAYDAEGTLEIHGVVKKVKQKIMLSKDGDKVKAAFTISLKPQDYNIAIPSLVKSKISENVKTEGEFVLE